MQELGSMATGPRSRFARKLSQMKTAAEEDVYGVANMTANERVEFQVRLSNAETTATTLNIADAVRNENQVEREIDGITSDEQKQLRKELSIRLIEFEVWWKAIGVQELRKIIEQCVVHFGYPKMHLVSHFSESIWLMGSGDNSTPDISERLHIWNVRKVCWSTTTVNYIRQMLKHNDYIEETLSHLAVQGWYDSASAKVFKLLSATNTQRNTRRAHILHLQHHHQEQFFRPVSQQVHHLTQTHVHRVCRSIKLTSLRDASVDFGIPNFGNLFHAQSEEDWGQRSLWTGARIWSECTHTQYIDYTSEWAVVLPSTISLPYICWASGTSLQEQIYQCQPRDNAQIS